MFEALGMIAGAWREVLHVSEWTGLTVGALAGLGALAWFYPPLRTLAISVAVNAVCVYAGVIYGNHIGRADVKAQWDAAIVKAEKAEAERTAKIAADTEAKYTPVIDEMTRKQKERDAYVRKLEKDLSVAKSGSACFIGAPHLQLRNRQRS